MKYLIDGYNLAHRLTLRAGHVSTQELAQARTRLLKHLADRHGDESPEVTVVFDAMGARGIETQQTISGLDVRMAVDQSADDLIEALVRAHSAPKQLTIVSDDHRVRASGRPRNCHVLECEEYLDLLDQSKPRPNRSVSAEKPEGLSPSELAEWEQAFSEPLPRRRDR